MDAVVGFSFTMFLSRDNTSFVVQCFSNTCLEEGSHKKRFTANNRNKHCMMIENNILCFFFRPMFTRKRETQLTGKQMKNLSGIRVLRKINSLMAEIRN